MATPVLRGFTSGAPTTESPTVLTAAGTLAGDTVFFGQSINYAELTDMPGPTAPDVTFEIVRKIKYGNILIGVWRGVVGTDGVKTITAVGPGDTSNHPMCHTFAGNVVLDGAVVEAGTAAGNAVTLQAVSPTDPAAMLLSYYSLIQFVTEDTAKNQIQIPLPAGQTRGEAPPFDGWVEFVSGRQTLTAAGSTGTKTATAWVASSSGFAGMMFAVRATSAPSTSDEAAIVKGWGNPLPTSDEFNYTGAPDTQKWNSAYNGPGHGGNGIRTPSAVTMTGTTLKITGDANGNQGGIPHKLGQQYGRWEVRARTGFTGTTGQPYHAVLIIWPDSERWPEDGEYDFFEIVMGQTGVSAFWHYPHDPLTSGDDGVQQIGSTKSDVDITQWHNYAFEWTANGLTSYIDGVQWHTASGGARTSPAPARENIQDMPSGHLTAQVDMFDPTGTPMRPGFLELDWVRIYPLVQAAPTVNAGANVPQHQIGTAFTRTAVESGDTASITARKWFVKSGPAGYGLDGLTGPTIDSDAALSWVPGSTPAGSADIRHPRFQEAAFEFTSTAENSRTDWYSLEDLPDKPAAYPYIEDILDGRGGTGGIVGFTTATGDMLPMVQQYVNEKPTGNLLQRHLPGLQACADFGDTVADATYGVDGGGASDIYNTELKSQGFEADWRNSALNDPIFRKVQRDFRRSMYWDTALGAAMSDGLPALGLLLYYDTIVNHGPGVANSGDGSFTDIRSRTTGTKPSAGGSRRTWMQNFLVIRRQVLTEWEDNPGNGRLEALDSLVAPTTPNYDLTGVVSWNMYDEPFSFNQPQPPADSILGTYVLTYQATHASGTAADDVTVTVTTDGPAPVVAPDVSAGADVTSHTAGTQFIRTATNTGGEATTWEWKIQAGVGVGEILSTSAAVSWTPSLAGNYTLRVTGSNGTGSDFDDVTLTVQAAGTPDPGAPVLPPTPPPVDGTASDWSAEVSGRTKFSGAWLHHPGLPETILVLPYGGVGRTESRDRAKTALQFVGRRFPVYDVGEARAESIQINSQIIREDGDVEEKVAKLRAIGEDAAVVLFRDGRGRKVFAMPTDWTMTDLDQGGYEVSFLLNRVDFDEALPGVE